MPQLISLNIIVTYLLHQVTEFAKGSNCFSFRHLLGGQLGSALLKDGNPLVVHYVMFIPTLMGQGSVQQQADWLLRAWSGNIVGTYAQVYHLVHFR